MSGKQESSIKFIAFFTERPITTLMIYSILVLAGIISFFQMPVDLMPGGDTGVITIFIGIRGGLPPADIEALVTKPVEDEMASLPNLEDIISVSRKEKAVISLMFKAGTDSSRASLEIQERLAKIRSVLPREIEKPVVSRYDESQSPILILAMSSKHFTPEEMREIADNQLKPQLKRIKGVANVEIGGGRERKILVEFDQGRLEAYAIPIRYVIGQIGADNLNILIGKMENKRDSYFVRTVGAFKTLEDVGNLPIAVTKEGSRVRLNDIAEIKDYYLEAESYSRLNREPVVSAYIQKEALENTIATADRIKKSMEEFKGKLDSRIIFSIVSDQSIAIQKALKSVRSALIEGTLLASLILIIFLKDFLSASFIFASIPLSIVITLVVMNIFDLSLNVMTISGLAIASGMIVDDSIVVLEHVVNRRNRLFHLKNQGADPNLPNADPLLSATSRTLPVLATSEMLLALTASTLTTVIVFLPIVFLNPQVRMIYLGLSVTATSALLMSLLISVTVVPCLWANTPEKWLKESSFFSKYLWLFLQTKLNDLKPKLGRFFSKIQKVFRKSSKFFKKKSCEEDLIFSSGSRFRSGGMRYGFRTYRHWVALIMRRRYFVSVFLLIILVGCGFLYKFLDKEFSGSAEENEFTIFVELPSGTKLDVSDKVVHDVEKALNEFGEIQKTVKTSVARVEGWSSKIYVTLVPSAERSRSIREVINSLRPVVSKIGQEYSTFVYFSEPMSSKEFIIDVFGYDYNRLRDLAVSIAQKMEKVPGLVDIKLRYKPGRPEVRVEIDRQKASMFEFTVQEIAESMHAQIRGLRATYFLTPTAQVEMVARLKEIYRKTLEEVQILSLINTHGTIVPIRQFAAFEFGLTPSEVWRKNRERMIQVSANRGDFALSKVAKKTIEVLQGVQVPIGYYYEFGGDFPKMIETEKESKFAFIIMVLLVYAVLAALFESYSQPVIILTAVPLTLIGAIPLLYVTKTPVTLGTFIGLIMLGGISVKNSIMMIDVFNVLRKDRNVLRALLQAGQERIRPIVMTTLTTVLGLAPLVFNKEESGSLWAPLAVAVIGGLSVSTALILFVLPGFYLMMQDVKRWLKIS